MEKKRAEAFWKRYCDPRAGRGGDLKASEGFKSWVLPYDAVILLCEYADCYTSVDISALTFGL